MKIISERHRINLQYYENKGKRCILESDPNFSSLPHTLYQERILMIFVIFSLVNKKNWDENGIKTVI